MKKSHILVMAFLAVLAATGWTLFILERKARATAAIESERALKRTESARKFLLQELPGLLTPLATIETTEKTTTVPK